MITRKANVALNESREAFDKGRNRRHGGVAILYWRAPPFKLYEMLILF
jgi:hypothetical protein